MIADSANNLIKQYLVDEFLQMDQFIDNILLDKHLIKAISLHLIYSGGKRLRPGLLLLTAKMFGYKGSAHINLAAAIEFIHTATLLHDDVVDQSELRRSKKTANNIWGNQAPILVGDYLLSQSFQIAVQEENIQVLKVLSKAAGVIAEGEVLQLTYLSNFDLTQKDYFKIIRAKTAELFGISTRIGAIIASQEETVVNNLYNFGINLGIAFQIIDDILDYCGSSNNMGKELGDDFREGKITLPVLLSYSEGSSHDREFLEEVFTNSQKSEEDFEVTREIIIKNRSIEKSYLFAQRYLDLAYESIQYYGGEEERAIFTSLLDFSIKRAY